MLGVVTLLYSSDYLPGTLTLAYQLRKLLPKGSHEKKLCLILSEELVEEGQLGDTALNVLETLFDEIVQFKPIGLSDPIIKQNQINLMMLENRSELAFTFLKLHLWELTQYDKVLYLDSDVLPLDSDIFKIFDHVSSQTSDQIAAVPDCGWPDLFNSGVMVIKPNKEKYKELHDMATKELSIDGADQGILNQFFNPMCHDGNRLTEWIRLPFFYNVTSPNAGYQYSPAIKFFANKLKLVHFIGKNKPWKHGSTGGIYNDKYRNQWWSLYMELCQQYFQSELDIDIDQLCRKTKGVNLSSDDRSEEILAVNTTPSWNPAAEPPSKYLPAEAPNLNIAKSYNWESELVVIPDDTPMKPVKDTSIKEPIASSDTTIGDVIPSVEEEPLPHYERPKPIFPWELNTDYKPSRVFPDD
ncbi:unnamed protein product [Kluyveromyces dobzhanskii CBS 2104]|uniref:glycogenin glucosyltransferase n=1 Tax=Kluyveromyces dobzhanskii CBS 2104 TaxID=1427455 RepID=A0A0A8LAP5_9SACH|nr:unnamed protein product [Kluyveromyces dobzhanskii CBS 2104]